MDEPGGKNGTVNDALPARRVTRNVTITLASIVGVILIAFLWIVVLAPGPMDFATGSHVGLSVYKGENPTGVPKELRDADLIERGKYLARAADCVACHTAEGGVPFAGGRAFVLPFGTLYSTNITPDKDTGIGRYRDSDWLLALHQGVGLGNKKLYPAMPFASYAYMTDADAIAIKAYLFSLDPAHAPDRVNTLRFPFDQRALMGVWSVLFNRNERFEPRVGHNAQWNRGAYLVEAMAHCGECHTPRNLLQALNHRQKFAGAVQAGWRAYNITSDSQSGIGDWGDADLGKYLAIGHADSRGTAAGPMGEAVDYSLRYLTAGDITAIVTYVRSVLPLASPDLPQRKRTSASESFIGGSAVNPYSIGVSLYAGACAGCHGWSGVSRVPPNAALTGIRSVNDPTATNVIQVVLSGAHRLSNRGEVVMPPFGSIYTDAEIASLANFVTARFGSVSSRATAETITSLRGQDAGSGN